MQSKFIENLLLRTRQQKAVKRGLALLCAIVMLITFNSMKFEADTLERIPMCGYEDHEHGPECYAADGTLTCDRHVHTDACYQQRPCPEVEDQGEMALPADENGHAQPEAMPAVVDEAPVEAAPEYVMGGAQDVTLSGILEALEIDVDMRDVLEVGQALDSDDAPLLVDVQPLEDDYAIRPLAAFEEAELAIVTGDDVLVVRLLDAEAPQEDASEIVAEETGLELSPEGLEPGQSDVENEAEQAIGEETPGQSDAEPAQAGEEEATEPSDAEAGLEMTTEDTGIEQPGDEAIEGQLDGSETGNADGDVTGADAAEPDDDTVDADDAETDDTADDADDAEDADHAETDDDTEGSAAAEGRVATVDVSGMEPPFSLKALLDAADVPEAAGVPEAADVAEAADAAEDDAGEIETEYPAEAGGAVEAPAARLPESEWQVAYDEQILAIEQTGDDWIVTPLCAFESTEITVDDGRKTALALVNWAPEDDGIETLELGIARVSAMEGELPAETEGSAAELTGDEAALAWADVEAYLAGPIVPVSRNKAALRTRGATVMAAAADTAVAGDGDTPAAGTSHTEYRAFDISLENVDESQYSFHVELTLPEPAVGRDFRLFHIHEGQVEEITGFECVAEPAKGDMQAVRQIAFETENFSSFVLSYTVDFHWDVDGETFEWSIPGGGCMVLSDLVRAMGIAEDDPATVEDEFAAFMAGVADVQFSAPELMSIHRADADTNVGDIRETLGLECEYSAELTEEQIAEINAQPVQAGDWALISLRPFATEETLTVTMQNGDTWTVKVTDAQISTHVITADGEHFRITVTYDDTANIPDGAVLVAEEIPAGSEEYERYLAETTVKWEEADKEGYISFCRFFDVEIRKDGEKIEPETAVQVEISHEDGLAIFEDEKLSVIHFADEGTEIIDDLQRNEAGTEIIYAQEGFSVIGTVSTVKDSGWPTANGQYVLVLQDGDDYYALKQDGTLTKIRYFNNTVSFIGEGTTTTDYINDYLWYVVSSGNRGKISDEYTEYNATPVGQTFIDLNNENIFSGTSRQLFIRDGKIYCSGQLPGYSGYQQITLSASNGQLSRVILSDPSASPVSFAPASSFTANDNETDLFTQVEVESIIAKWREQKIQEATYDKTAEVYDYENRVYRIDVAASSSDYEVSPSIALEFVVDASRSMFFPTSLTQVGTFNGTNASNVRDWINTYGNTDQVYFVIRDKDGAATQLAIFWDPNSAYQVDHWWGTETKYGQWRWVDASNYNPPDDVANGGADNTRYEGGLLDDWTWGNLNDGKIYTTPITGTSTGTYGTRKTWISRIEYLKQCVRVASQVIYAVDDKAQIGLIGFNASVTDYGTYGKDDQETLLSNLDNISLAGGTNHQDGLQMAINKYQKGTPYYNEHYAGRKHVVVLVTDGAPNATGVNWTTIGNVATTLKNLEDDFGNKTELYTMGLSLTNVGSNQGNLFGVSSGTGYTYAGEDAAQIINAVTKMVDGIFVQANLVADVKDVIDPAFYPVNKADGHPLAENDWIDLNGTKVNAGANNAAGQIKKDASTGNWYVEWKNQSIDWPTMDSNGGIEEPGWHGTVFVKAKEDFLGGNGISTNAAGSQIEANKFIVRGETQPHDLPEGEHTTTLETPYVNVDELDITKNDTEWTVYLGTNVNPLKEVKALWEQVKVKEVVTKTDSDHRMSSDGSLTYQYAANTNDNRQEVDGREEFPITDLITLTDDDWTTLLNGGWRIFNYSAYDHSNVGTIMVSLKQEVKEGEMNLSESPHDTTVTGNAVEKYTLTVSYRPAGANITDWHTGSFGSGMAGSRAGTIGRENTHIINVYVKGLQITKVNLDDQVLQGAKFALYRTAREGETDLREIDGGHYCKIAELGTSSTGIAIKEQIEQLEEGEQYYLVETMVPPGYLGIAPIPVSLGVSDVYTPKPGTETQTTKPETGIYDWTQNTSLVLNAEAGVKRTNADNTAVLTHSVVPDSVSEIVYYRISNNPGASLPSTGGAGTLPFTVSGIALVALALVLLIRRRAA